MTSTKEKIPVHELVYEMDHNEINQAAIDLLYKLLDCCTLNLVSQLTGITRPTLYRWMDEKLPLDAMDYRQSTWFILVVETSPKIQALLQRGPISNPRLAKRLLDEGEDNAA